MFKKFVVAGLAVMLLAGASIFLFNRDNSAPITNPSSKPDTSITNNSTGDQDGQYTNFDEAKLTNKYLRHIIFFHAAWCPDCRAFKQNLTKAGAIPEDVQILEVDYDKATSLKNKYGVVIQSTFVEVDSMGNLLAKWLGLYKSSSNSFSDIDRGLSEG